MPLIPVAMLSIFPANRLLRHGLFWLFISAYFLVPQWIYPEYRTTIYRYFFRFDYHHSPHFLLILFGYTLALAMVYTYAFSGWVLPSLLRGQYMASFGRYSLLTIIVCYSFRLLKALHVAILDPWLQHQSARTIDPHHFTGLFFQQVYIYEYSTIILVVTIYRLFIYWRQNQQEANRLIQQKLQQDIQLLKSQLNPGFMLTNLDQLYVLIDQQDRQAPAVVLTLANFLSYVLYEADASRVSLAHDLTAMQRYIELEQVRLGKQIDVSVNLTGTLSGQTIAPLLWLPFIENAFQHSLVTNDQAWVSLNVSVHPDSLRFTLSNSKVHGTSIPMDERGGLSTIRKRLDALYPEQYRLTVKADEDTFLVVLTVQMTTQLAIASDAFISVTPLSTL